MAALDVGADDALGRPTIARALIAAGFATTVEDAFGRIIGHGAPGYVRREGLGPEEAIATIAAAGGIPVLAHFREAPTRLDVMRELAEAGLRGLEVYYRTFDAATVEAVRPSHATSGSSRPAAVTTTATSAPTPRRIRPCGCRPRSARSSFRRSRGSSARRRVCVVLDAVGRAKLDRLALAPAPQVQRLDEDAERHGRVDVGLVDVEAEAVRDQRDADEQQERQRQHLDRRMVVDEPREWPGRDQHHADGDDDGDDHDRHLIDQADRGQDRIEREHDIEQDDLHEHAAQSGRACARCRMRLIALERLVDLGGGLPEQEDAATDEDDVAPREVTIEQRDERLRQADDPRDRQQQQDPHSHGQPQADVSGLIALVRRKPLHEDRDEDDVVDAEDDLEHRQRQQGDPGLGGCEQGDEVHVSEHSGDAGARRYHGAAVSDTRLSPRSLPVLEVLPASAPTTRAAPRSPEAPADARLAEYVPDLASLPRFHVWTLGCQMNRSDSEEMAGRLLAAGCAEAPSMDTADLVVINTCAIREGAEQKVIGRQGHLTKLKAANPGLRVVLTGCSVREPDRGGLRRRFPAVDLFLRPDEEPELVDRLGLASAQGAIGSFD